ncbi:MAG: class II aldolase/adducin family protein [Treponema sp.]|nr:class II aldolase/adducin family protein [Treponema sp.]
MSIDKNIDILVELSQLYGSDPEYVLAGGGNTSWKDQYTLYVKASGFSLAEVTADSFVKMDREALSIILGKIYPESSAQRESAVLVDMMTARKPGEEQKRPSVEALLHDIIPFALVVHTHPALVNGITCSVDGEKAIREIFGDDVIWIPSINPGYILSIAVKNAIDEHKTKQGKKAAIIFLQNHGVFVGADNADDIKKLYGEIVSKIDAKIKRKPDFSDEKREMPSCEIAKAIAEFDNSVKTVAFMTSREISAFTKDRSSFASVSSAFTPDHIVYAGSDPLFTNAQNAEGILKDLNEHKKKTGRSPKIIVVQGVGVFSAAVTEKAAKLALDLFKDSVKVAVYTESFGEPLFMADDKIDFINNWEVEQYRSSVSTK